MTLRAWKGRLPTSNRLGSSCAPAVPLCDGLPEIVDLHTPWTLAEVRLEARGDGLSRTAEAVLAGIAKGAGPALASSTLGTFDPLRGEAAVTAVSGPSIVSAEAIGGPDGVSGTQAIRVTYREREDSSQAYRSQLEAWFQEYRKALVRRYGPPGLGGQSG